MRLRFLAIPLCLAVAIATLIGARTVSQAQSAAPAAPPANPAQIAQGKYIVTSVGMCLDCHGQDLHGGPLTFGPLGALPAGMKFANKASDIVRIAHRFTPAQMATFLETGLNPRNNSADPPMPQYRMNQADAEAVAAYLVSLPQ